MALGGLLLDLEGVLYQASEPVEGAVEAVAQCRDMGLNIRFLTNTTTKSKSAVVEKLNHQRMSLPLLAQLGVSWTSWMQSAFASQLPQRLQMISIVLRS
jgi:ribonucleotide monophosphatase NagD (HAD superfamily)